VALPLHPFGLEQVCACGSDCFWVFQHLIVCAAQGHCTRGQLLGALDVNGCAAPDNPSTAAAAAATVERCGCAAPEVAAAAAAVAPAPVSGGCQKLFVAHAGYR
jgi:hypothetical protein